MIELTIKKWEELINFCSKGERQKLRNAIHPLWGKGICLDEDKLSVELLEKTRKFLENHG